MKAERLFHVFSPEAWGEFQASGEDLWRPASLQSEGFVHLSYGHQLLGTLEAHYGRYLHVELVELELKGEGLVVEPSRGGALFPHLYRPLDRREIVQQWHIPRENGAWLLGQI